MNVLKMLVFSSFRIGFWATHMELLFITKMSCDKGERNKHKKFWMLFIAITYWVDKVERKCNYTVCVTNDGNEIQKFKGRGGKTFNKVF